MLVAGPIEFLKDTGPAHTVPPSEYGGSDGLIQPEVTPVSPGGVSVDGHTVLSAGEVRGVTRRYAGVVQDLVVQQTGTLADNTIVDPVTGRVVDPGDLADVSKDGGTLSDLKPA